MSTGWGTPKYGKDSYAKKIRIKGTKPGEPDNVIVFRILPPIHKQAKLGNGKWCKYKGQHFGYKVPSARDRNESFSMPFLCVEEKNFQTGMINRRCGECENIERTKATLEQRASECKAKGMSEKDTEELLSPLSGWLREHNCDRKWHIHVKLLEGEFGTLLLNHRDEKKLLDMKIDQLKKDTGIDAIAYDQGVWFKATASGAKLQRKVDIEVVRETERHPTMGMVQVIKPAPLTEEDFENASRVLQDLDDTVRVLSSEQIDLLVSCSGDPEEIEKIMGISQTATPSEASPAQAPKPVTRTAPVSQPVTPPPAPVTPPPAEVEDDEAIALRALEAARAKKKAAAAVATAETIVKAVAKAPADPPPSKSALSEMSEDDFRARYSKQQGK